MRGIYIHIPFCRKICNYCDFYKMVVSDQYKSKYVDYLLKDLKMTIDKYNLSNIDTIYIGGGTPSCLPSDLLEKILNSLSKYFKLNDLKEFTIEANPEDLNVEFIELISKYHISRVSIGVQTFNNKFYNILGRCTDYETLTRSVKLLNDYGISNYSFDLIYALPNSKEEDLCIDIEKLLCLNPKHISTYSLILEERTILNKKYENKEFEMIDEDLDRKMYDLISQKLTEHDFCQYETSNYALKGYESKHNLIYWNCEEYFGLGPAAASFVGNLRFTKVQNMSKYYEMIDENIEPVLEYEELENRRLMEDYVMLGLRKIAGLSLVDFSEKFSKNIYEEFSKIQELLDNDILICQNNYLKINKEFTYISNYIIGKILFD